MFEICGNNVTDLAAGEECDDGNLIAGDGCSPNCQTEFCGDGFVTPPEHVMMRIRLMMIFVIQIVLLSPVKYVRVEIS